MRLPLDTDESVERRVADIVGRAVQHQIWLLLLDAHGVQLPVVIPVGGLPVSPGRDDSRLWGEFAAQVAETAEATSVVCVLERYADSALTSADVSWASAIVDGCREAGVQLRALALSHRRGVRLIAPDEYT